MNGLRKFKKLAGAAGGFLIVVAFAGAIHSANLWFSHSLYSRDAMDDANRFERELKEYVSTAGSSLTASSATGSGLRSSIDTWKMPGAVEDSPLVSFPAYIE